MLADVLDGSLSLEEQARFDRHLERCTGCAALLADAQSGAAWLAMLRSHTPEPSANLVTRILANTSVRAAAEAASAEQAQQAAIAGASLLARPAAPFFGVATAATAEALPPGAHNLLPFRPRLTARLGPTLGAMLQTRMAMTAAMAFFSVALTFNLLGVHVTALRARDLTPSSLRRSVSETNARVVRYYESFRVVYELESRVHDLQHGNESDADPQRTLQSPDSNRQQQAPDSDGTTDASPKDGAPKPAVPAPKSAAPQPTREPRSSSTTNVHGGHDANAAARHSLPTALPLGPTLPVIFRGHPPSFQKGALA